MFNSVLEHVRPELEERRNVGVYIRRFDIIGLTETRIGQERSKDTEKKLMDFDSI